MEKPSAGKKANVPISETGTQHRNQRGPPVLQEDINHKQYEQKRGNKGFYDLLHAFRNCKRGIQELHSRDPEENAVSTLPFFFYILSRPIAFAPGNRYMEINCRRLSVQPGDRVIVCAPSSMRATS